MDFWKLQGEGARAAIKHERQALVFVVNALPHLAIATCIVGLHLAIEMPDDPGIQRKIGAAHRSSDHESGDGDDEYDDDAPNRNAKKTKSSESSSKSSEDNESQRLFLRKAAVNPNDRHC